MPLMIYLMGDLQGCANPLRRMLDVVGFSASRDHLYALGDLVNRGPDSLGVLQTLAGLQGAATCLLGNHDLHLLAVAQGVRHAHTSDTLGPILESPDRAHWLDWLRHQRLAVQAHGWLMVHAGVLPQWTPEQVLALAGEVQAQLQGPDLHAFLAQMYSNAPEAWSDELRGPDRWRCVVNALTRLRFCSAEGVMEFATKEAAGGAPAGYMPWFEVPGRLTAGTPVAFGHWSTLGLINRSDLLSLDTGCVWGGHLTAVRLTPEGRDVIQVPCEGRHRPAPR